MWSIYKSNVRNKVIQSSFLLLLASCGDRSATGLARIDAASTQCPSGTAAIQVGDGFLRILCGCTGASETPGVVFPAPGNLICHLPQNPTPAVFFYFQGITLRHQIIPTGAETFPASPIMNPGSNLVSWGSILPKPATTYSFIDTISGMTGQLIAP
jgi:hypothetical protein